VTDSETQRVQQALGSFQIETPSWGFADTGTRFGKFGYWMPRCWADFISMTGVMRMTISRLQRLIPTRRSVVLSIALFSGPNRFWLRRSKIKDEDEDD